MIEKNIIGVLRIQEQAPVFQHQVDDKRRVTAIKAAATELEIKEAKAYLSEHDSLEDWHEFSEHLKHKQEPGSQGGSRQPSQGQARQPNQPDAQDLEHRRLDEAQAHADHAIEERVRLLQMMQAPHPKTLHELKRQLATPLPPLPELQLHIHETPAAGHSPGSLRLQDVMTRRVVCLTAGATLAQLATICQHRNISGLPVLDDEHRLVGVICLKDLLEHLYIDHGNLPPHLGGELVEIEPLAELDEPVSRYMNKDFLALSPETSVRDACRLMSRSRHHRVVVTEGDQVRGIFSSGDAIRLLASADLQAG